MKFALLALLTLVLATSAPAQPAVQNPAPVRLGILSEQESASRVPGQFP
jgi:Skp family chaperone for outer membrane proteins